MPGDGGEETVLTALPVLCRLKFFDEDKSSNQVSKIPLLMMFLVLVFNPSASKGREPEHLAFKGHSIIEMFFGNISSPKFFTSQLDPLTIDAPLIALMRWPINVLATRSS